MPDWAEVAVNVVCGAWAGFLIAALWFGHRELERLRWDFEEYKKAANSGNFAAEELPALATGCTPQVPSAGPSAPDPRLAEQGTGAVHLSDP